jgi:hypothetical protein
MKQFISRRIAQTWTLIALSGQLAYIPHWSVFDDYTILWGWVLPSSLENRVAGLFSNLGSKRQMAEAPEDSITFEAGDLHFLAKAFMDKWFHVSPETSPRVLSS